MEEKENTENTGMGKRKHSHDTKIVIKYYYERIRQNTWNFLKWMGLSVLTGLVVGGASAVFAGCIKAATEYRDTHNWIFMLLPVAGVLIVFMYERIGRQDGGTNQVLATIKSKDDVPFLSAPLIFVSTLLTHLTGGSAGREGASIQFGGSIGNWLGKLAHLDEFDHHVMIMCGMSVSTDSIVATGMGIDPETFPVHSIPGLTVETGLKMALIAVGCGILSILFCILLKIVGQLYTKYLKNPYIRIVVAAGVIILITICLNTKDYMGAGSGLIARAIENGEAGPLDFLWKMLLTALTMRAGYRGGEIVPAFSVGATFGCVAGGILGFSPELAAAAGMVALFCGVTNCPITAMLISFELFGFSGAAYYLIAISISYAVSGYYSLYKDQTIVYSKYKARYINRKTR